MYKHIKYLPEGVLRGAHGAARDGEAKQGLGSPLAAEPERAHHVIDHVLGSHRQGANIVRAQWRRRAACLLGCTARLHAGDAFAELSHHVVLSRHEHRARTREGGRAWRAAGKARAGRVGRAAQQCAGRREARRDSERAQDLCHFSGRLL